MKSDPAFRLTMLSRDGCHLCNVMQSALEPLSAQHGFVLEVVDIDATPALVRAYGAAVPVLIAGTVEICRHRLDTARLETWLAQARGTAPQGQIG